MLKNMLPIISEHYMPRTKRNADVYRQLLQHASLTHRKIIESSWSIICHLVRYCHTILILHVVVLSSLTKVNCVICYLEWWKSVGHNYEIPYMRNILYNDVHILCKDCYKKNHFTVSHNSNLFERLKNSIKIFSAINKMFIKKNIV